MYYTYIYIYIYIYICMYIYMYYTYASQPACQPDGRPAVRPGCARCRAPEISHNKGNGGGFTKILFRRRFTRCAIALPFILHSFPCSSLFLSKVRISPKVTIACNGFCLLRHTKTWPARDIISYSGTMFCVYFITS